eukprot:13909951-Alexandrium_andersonii.AAC.1
MEQADQAADAGGARELPSGCALGADAQSSPSDGRPGPREPGPRGPYGVPRLQDCHAPLLRAWAAEEEARDGSPLAAPPACAPPLPPRCR